MISVKGGNSVKSDKNANPMTNYTDYNIVKDIDINQLLDDREFIFNELKNINDDEFFNEQVVYYYKSLLNGCKYTDNQNKHIDFYVSELVNKLKNILKEKNTLIHFNRLCDEFDIKKDLNIALTRLYNKLIEKNKKYKIRANMFKDGFVTTSLLFEESKMKHMLNTVLSVYSEDVLNIFNQFCCGIYVQIKDNKLYVFQPFFNKNYKNEWKNIKFKLHNGTFVKNYKTYYNNKVKYFKKEYVIDDIHKWWNNGFIVDNEYYYKYINGKKKLLYWSNYGFLNLIYLLKQTCKNNIVKDCEFIINKRDYPLEYKGSIPILSFYSNETLNNSNICIPANEDIENVFKNRDLINMTSWENKQNIAFFRGSLTGIGLDSSTNQRIKLAELDKIIPNLDAKITTFNMRDRFIVDNDLMVDLNNTNKITINEVLKDNNVEKIISYVDPKYIQSLNITKDHFIPLNEQSKYKYLIYCQGHSAANRYLTLMRLGSVILKVESTCKARDLWFFKYLKPYIHYVPVKADMSDLEDQIKWCINNDNKCKMIVLNNELFAKTYFTKEYLLSYMSNVLNPLSTTKSDTHIQKLKKEIMFMLNIKTDDIFKSLNTNNLIKELNLPSELPIDLLSDTSNNLSELLLQKHKIDKYMATYIKQYELKMIDCINDIYNIIETI